jgi:hypothetical protein
VTERRRRKRKLLLDDLQETRLYWQLKEEEIDLSLEITRFGRGYGSAVRRTT